MVQRFTGSMMACCLGVLAAALAFAPGAAQQRGFEAASTPSEAAPSGNYFALVIGIDRYSPPLPL